MSRPSGAGGDEDEASDATDEQAEAIHEVISYTLWDRGCGDNFDLPRTETV